MVLAPWNFAKSLGYNTLVNRDSMDVVVSMAVEKMHLVLAEIE